jgi:hypothetical protein
MSDDAEVANLLRIGFGWLRSLGKFNRRHLSQNQSVKVKGGYRIIT